MLFYHPTSPQYLTCNYRLLRVPLSNREPLCSELLCTNLTYCLFPLVTTIVLISSSLVPAPLARLGFFFQLQSPDSAINSELIEFSTSNTSNTALNLVFDPDNNTDSKTAKHVTPRSTYTFIHDRFDSRVTSSVAPASDSTFTNIPRLWWLIY